MVHSGCAPLSWRSQHLGSIWHIQQGSRSSFIHLFICLHNWSLVYFVLYCRNKKWRPSREHHCVSQSLPSDGSLFLFGFSDDLRHQLLLSKERAFSVTAWIFFFDHMAIKFFMFISDRGIWIFRSLRASCLGSFSDKDFTLLFVETSSWPTVILTSPAVVIWAACYLFAGPEELLTQTHTV